MICFFFKPASKSMTNEQYIQALRGNSKHNDLLTSRVHTHTHTRTPLMSNTAEHTHHSLPTLFLCVKRSVSFYRFIPQPQVATKCTQSLPKCARKISRVSGIRPFLYYPLPPSSFFPQLMMVKVVVHQCAICVIILNYLDKVDRTV